MTQISTKSRNIYPVWFLHGKKLASRPVRGPSGSILARFYSNQIVYLLQGYQFGFFIARFKKNRFFSRNFWLKRTVLGFLALFNYESSLFFTMFYYEPSLLFYIDWLFLLCQPGNPGRRPVFPASWVVLGSGVGTRVHLGRRPQNGRHLPAPAGRTEGLQLRQVRRLHRRRGRRQLHPLQGQHRASHPLLQDLQHRAGVSARRDF